jgi:polyphosphate kinase
VTAIIELRARFDEESNIEVANLLQEAGAVVVYGIVGYKTHAKMIMVVRRENNKLFVMCIWVQGITMQVMHVFIPITAC